nr:class I tRNA ligase family protein [PVC group bacterium]
RHTGGVKNRCTEHDEEIAKSEGATGKQCVKYWMHSAHLIVDGKKMSKSLGNFFTLREVMERGYTGREIRYLLLATHYRQSLNFTFDGLSAAKSALARVDDFIERLSSAETTGSKLPDWALNAKRSFEAALDNDLNIAEALASLFDMVHKGNRALDESDLFWDSSAVLKMLESFDSVLGVLKKESAQMDADIADLLEARDNARKQKEWGESDRIRDVLKEKGWEVRDTPDGQKVKQI